VVILAQAEENQLEEAKPNDEEEVKNEDAQPEEESEKKEEVQLQPV
jgi:hypothetical protein